MSQNSQNKNNFDYAIDTDEAIKRNKKWINIDPFPKILPALLNSADIADYVRVTGMVWPFNPTQLKSAAYEMLLGNEILYWNDKGKETHKTINDSDTLTFHRNSITYVTLKENFLLPDYIAVRFNLTINHVHKGLLLGTGPLVNPGFRGKLMIPIHNLTPNDYPIRPGDPLISVEFTKLSSYKDWERETERPDPVGEYVEKHIEGASFNKYLQKALPHDVHKVESSLSTALNKAEREIKTVKRTAQALSLTVSLATLASIAALAWMTWQIFQSYQTSNNEEISDLYSIVSEQKNNLKLVEYEIKRLRLDLESKKLNNLELKIKSEKEISEGIKEQINEKR